MISDLLSSDFAWKLGGALLHSLWQFLIVGALVALSLAASARRSPQFRYCIAIGGLAVMAALFVVTFLWIPAPGNRSLPQSVSGSAGEFRNDLQAARGEVRKRIKGEITKDPQNVFDSAPMASRPWTGANSWMAWIVCVWLAGFSLLSLWNIGGWVIVRRLRRRGIIRPAAIITQRLSEMAGRMKLSRSIEAFESMLVEAPVIVVQVYREPNLRLLTSAV